MILDVRAKSGTLTWGGGKSICIKRTEMETFYDLEFEDPVRVKIKLERGLKVRAGKSFC